jgi:hypothetical protein
MPAVEEEGKVGMPAPGLDAPADRRLVVAAVAPRHERRLGIVGRRVDAEFLPLLHSLRPCLRIQERADILSNESDCDWLEPGLRAITTPP